MQKKNTNTLYAIILFCTIWVYYSLNARYINISAFTLLRWVFPFALIGIAVLLNNGRITVPPMLFWWFSVAVLVPAVLGADPIISITKYISWVLIFYGCYVFFMQLRIKDALNQSLSLLCAVLVIFQCINFVFAVLGINIVGGRGTGITTNANTLGIYSNLAFWAGIYFRRQQKDGRIRLLWIFFLATTVYTTLASGSRTAFVVMGMNILALAFMTVKNRRTFWALAAVLAVLAVLAIGGKLNFLGISAIDRLAEEGGTAREDLWEIGLNVWREHKIFGVGYTVSARFNTEVKDLVFHNSYLSFLAECGLWGAVFFLLGMLPIILNIVAYFGKPQFIKSHPEFSIGTIMLISLAISAWSESFMFAVGSTEGFTFWFLLAWLWAYVQKIDVFSQKEGGQISE